MRIIKGLVLIAVLWVMVGWYTTPAALAIRAAQPGERMSDGMATPNVPSDVGAVSRSVRFWSPDRRYELIVEPGDGQQHQVGTATLQDVSGTTANVIWTATLADLVQPSVVLVSNRGDYVVILNMGHVVSPSDLAAAIYGPQGQMVGQLTLGQILTSRQLQAMSGNPWLKHAYLAQHEMVMVLETMDGKMTVVDLTQATVKMNWRETLKSLLPWMAAAAGLIIALVVWYRRRLPPPNPPQDEQTISQ